MAGLRLLLGPLAEQLDPPALFMCTNDKEGSAATCDCRGIAGAGVEQLRELR
jgi:hypothetical protein